MGDSHPSHWSWKKVAALYAQLRVNSTCVVAQGVRPKP